MTETEPTPSKIAFQKLSASDDRSQFDCGNLELNEYLKKYARQKCADLETLFSRTAPKNISALSSKHGSLTVIPIHWLPLRKESKLMTNKASSNRGSISFAHVMTDPSPRHSRCIDHSRYARSRLARCAEQKWDRRSKAAQEPPSQGPRASHTTSSLARRCHLATPTGCPPPLERAAPVREKTSLETDIA